MDKKYFGVLFEPMTCLMTLIDDKERYVIAYHLGTEAETKKQAEYQQTVISTFAVFEPVPTPSAGTQMNGIRLLHSCRSSCRLFNAFKADSRVHNHIAEI